MSMFAFTTGTPKGYRIKLTGTSATTIVQATNSTIFLVRLRITNNSGGALTPLVEAYDGTNAIIYRAASSLADKASEDVIGTDGCIILETGNSVRITAAANLHVFATYIISNKTTG